MCKTGIWAFPHTIRIHPVCHVSQLEPGIQNTTVPRRDCQLVYAKWVGYPITNNASDWMLANAFDDDAGKSIADAYQYPDKPGPEKFANVWEKKLS
jgi:hypothetical protein